jgi:hypothetical protein
MISEYTFTIGHYSLQSIIIDVDDGNINSSIIVKKYNDSTNLDEWWFVHGVSKKTYQISSENIFRSDYEPLDRSSPLTQAIGLRYQLTC